MCRKLKLARGFPGCPVRGPSVGHACECLSNPDPWISWTSSFWVALVDSRTGGFGYGSLGRRSTDRVGVGGTLRAMRACATWLLLEDTRPVGERSLLAHGAHVDAPCDIFATTTGSQRCAQPSRRSSPDEPTQLAIAGRHPG